MSSVKQEQSLDQTQESETPQPKPSTTDRVVDSKYIFVKRFIVPVPRSIASEVLCRKFSNLKPIKIR
jgi:hypothetical protein